MFWHNINNEGGTYNFNINMILQGTDCEDVDWTQVPVDGVHWQLLWHDIPILGPSLLFSCINLWYVVINRVAMKFVK